MFVLENVPPLIRVVFVFSFNITIANLNLLTDLPPVCNDRLVIYRNKHSVNIIRSSFHCSGQSRSVSVV